ncbi:MAG: nucleoside monophosphate kinase [Candidatus Paceibacterota bacterium]
MNADSNKQFFIFVGRSGSGKGTQADLLKKSLEIEGKGDVVHLTTGAGFREFVTQDNYISSLSRALNDKGILQPEFLAVWNWANIFIKTLKGGETIILDGAPRKVYEVQALHSAINFLEYSKPTVINIDVSEGWARERLKGRGRDDDKEESDVTNRMNWFETDVLPVLDTYIHDPRYSVIHVNGEQTIEEVHNELVEKIKTIQ